MSDQPTNQSEANIEYAGAFGIGQPAPIIVEQPTPEAIDARLLAGDESVQALRAFVDGKPEPRIVNIESNNDPDSKITGSLVFGQLLLLAQDTVRHYHSDFYHDAVWISSWVHGQTHAAFFYGFDDCGTLIGTDPINASHRQNGYRIVVQRHRGWQWTVHMIPVKLDGQIVRPEYLSEREVR